ncbi:MAG: tetratricopeptide repeat protein [Bacteroidota bacterium]
MKKILILYVGLFSSLTLLGQPVERTVGNLPLISEVKSSLEVATGYAFQDNGLWISAQNRIPYKVAAFNESNKIYYKLGSDNFELLEIRDVMVENELYVVFTIQYKTGWYEFPILMELWHWQNGLNYFVFKASKLKEVMPNNIDWGEPYCINMDAFCSGILIDYNMNTLNSTIAYNIQKTLETGNISSHNLLIAVWPVEAKGMQLTRFRLIQVMNKKKLYGPYLEEKNRDRLFESRYYEADYPTFRAFIRYDEINPTLVTTDPKTGEDWFKRGVYHYRAGNFAQAISDLTEAAKYCPFDRFFMTYAYRANAREQMGDYSGALKDYDKAISLKPAETEYYSAWLITIYNRGVAKFNIKDMPGACQDWNTAAQMGLQDASMDANIRTNCKNYTYLGPATLPTAEISMATPTTSDYRRLYFEGMWKYQNGNYTEAVQNLDRAIELKPDLAIIPSIYSYRGASKLKLSNYRGAISDFDYCLAYMGSGKADSSILKTVYYNRGLANFFLGNQSEACDDFRKALRTGLLDQESLNFVEQVCR